jgi:hypothetical protein
MYYNGHPEIFFECTVTSLCVAFSFSNKFLRIGNVRMLLSTHDHSCLSIFIITHAFQFPTFSASYVRSTIRCFVTVYVHHLSNRVFYISSISLMACDDSRRAQRVSHDGN